MRSPNNNGEAVFVGTTGTTGHGCCTCRASIKTVLELPVHAGVIRLHCNCNPMKKMVKNIRTTPCCRGYDGELLLSLLSSSPWTPSSSSSLLLLRVVVD